MIKELGIAALLSLGIISGLNAQYNDKTAVNNNKYVSNKANEIIMPHIHSFYRRFEADMPFPLTSSGNIYWKSTSYLSNEKRIREIRGECSIDIKLLLLSLQNIYVGFITRINNDDKTIETIIYNNDIENPDLNHHDSLIAKQEGIDLNKVKDIRHEFADYRNSVLVDMETLKNYPIENNAVNFQEGYFLIPKQPGKDTIMTIRYKSKNYPVRTKIMSEDDDNYVHVDLTMHDFNDPNTKKNIVDKMNWLKIYFDRSFMPYKVIAEIHTLVGDKEVEAEYLK